MSYLTVSTDPFHITQLISKHLCGTITKAEEEILNQWLEERVENRETFEEMKSEQQSQQDLDFFEQLDVDAAWEKVSTDTKAGDNAFTGQKVARYAIYAAAVALLVFVSWMGWSRFNTQINDPAIANVQRAGNDVMPGSQKAVLLLSDGSRVDLAKDSGSLKELDGTTIAQHDGEIVYLNKDENKANPATIYNTLVVPKAGMYNLTLSDGTKVWVNAMSQLKFPVQFGAKDRRVSLEGEAYFEVAHDPDKPFIVETNGTQVKVLGTHFNINSYKSVTATLVEGAVEVIHDRESVLLRPGQQAAVTSEIVVHEADIEKAIAWKNGEFYFKSDDIAEIMGQLSRWYDVAVKYDEDIPEGLSYYGNISRSAKLSEALAILSFITDATFKIDGREVTVQFVNKQNL